MIPTDIKQALTNGIQGEANERALVLCRWVAGYITLCLTRWRRFWFNPSEDSGAAVVDAILGSIVVVCAAVAVLAGCRIGYELAKLQVQSWRLTNPNDVFTNDMPAGLKRALLVFAVALLAIAVMIGLRHLFTGIFGR